ncbi:MAG: PilZ domain-containing protein [Pseudomonadota bacterium]
MEKPAAERTVITDEYLNRRKHPRFEVEKAIYLEVVNKNSRSEAQNTIFLCNTLDISVGGLRIWVQDPVPEGSRVNIAVPEEEWKENLELAGKVMWSKPADGKPGYWLGLELEDTTHENMTRWFKVVQKLKP